MVAATTVATSLEGTTFGRYRLHRALARGGMATVYLARLMGAHGFRQWVAVKVMHPHLAADRHFVNMFLDEAHVASRIRHPNVSALLDFGEHDGIPYIVMEYLHGETVASVARMGWKAGAMPVWLCARVIADAARGLHSAHELRGANGDLRNVVHRDVSPQNIMVLYDGLSKIMDFGVAAASNRISDTTGGELKGKFAYMSPEQLRGQPLDRRSDVWALGVVLWEMTLGKRLFRGASTGESAVLVLEREVPHPKSVRLDYPESLADVVMGALRRDPKRRTPTAKAIADGLEQYLLGTGTVVGAEQVAEWMGTHFEAQRAHRDALIEEGPPSVEMPVEAFEPTGPASLGSSFSHSHVVPARSSRLARRLRVGAILFAAAAAGAALALGLMPRGGEEARSSATDKPRATRAALPVASGAGKADDELRTVSPVPVAPAPPSEPASAAAAEPASPPSQAETSPRPATRRARARRRAAKRVRVTKPAAESASSEPGSLNLLAIPAAEVWLGSRSLGRTPLVGVSLPPGRHRLTLRPVSGGEARSMSVAIRSGERTSRSVSLSSL